MYKTLILISVIYLILLTSCADSENKFIYEFDFPIFNSEFKPRTIVDRKNIYKEIVYKVNANFPAEEISKFYESEFEKIGLEKYKEDYLGKRIWVSLNQKTLEFEKADLPPAQYNASWTDKDRKHRIIMYLSYRYNAKNNLWDKEVLINIRISNFYIFSDDKSSF